MSGPARHDGRSARRSALPRRGALALVLAALLMSAGCTGSLSQTAAGQRLSALPEPSDWTLSASDVPGLDRPEAADIRLHIDAGRLGGSSGCNNFSAAYSFVGETLRVGAPAATKRGCPPPRAEIESALFRLLPALTGARRDGEALVLETAAGQALRFLPAAAGETP